MGKIITKQKRIGQLGVNLIERIVLRMGFKPQQMNAELDTGIDGLIEICDPTTGQASNAVLFFQSRARKEFDRETATTFEYQCGEDELAYWLSGNVPVLLIISRSDSDDEAYWIEVKSYFSDLKRRNDRRVTFDKTQNRFSPQCADDLRKIAISKESGIYFAAPPVVEKLFSNLFPVKHYAKRLFIASTDARRPGAIWGKAKELGVQLAGCEWFLKSGQLWSVHDLREPPWPQFVDRGSVEEFEMNEWALADEPEKERDFARLMRLCLQERLRRWQIGYDFDLEFYYFWSTPNRSPRSILLPGSKKPRTVFTPFQSKVTEGKVSYYRHQAFFGDFVRIDDGWHLSVTPTFHFTFDGRVQSRFAGELTQGIKRLERQGAVVGHLRLWNYVLMHARPESEALWSQGEAEYPHLTFDHPAVFDSKLGIEDESWLKREEKERAADLTADLEQQELFDQGGLQ